MNNLINQTSQNLIFEEIFRDITNILQVDMVWNNIVALSGAAGTGKTYLTTQLVKELSKKYKITVTAPTHKALKVLRKNLSYNHTLNVSTKTIHAFLNIKLMVDYDKGIQKFVPDKTKLDQSSADILIVDESSMVSKELYEYILDAVTSDRVKSVLFVGDYYQLLPIDSNKNFVSDIRIQYELKDIVRQAKDSYIIQIATKLREIIQNQEYISIQDFFTKNNTSQIEFFNTKEDFYNDFCKNENWFNEDKIITSFRNSDVDFHNNVIRKRFWNEKHILSPEQYISGDRIVFQDSNVRNGMILHHNSDDVIISNAEKKYSEYLDMYYWECRDANNLDFRIIDKNSLFKFNEFMKKLADKAKKEFDKEKRALLWENFFELREYFVDVKYSFASTIHKLQGSTYETVYIDLMSLSYIDKLDKDTLFRLMYVAITRASKNIKILIPQLKEKTLDDIFLKFLDKN